VPAAVAIALFANVTENGRAEHDYLPIGSGTIVAPDGLVLTAWHVVDPDRNRRELDRVVADAKAQGTELAVTLDPDYVLLLASDGRALAAPTWVAAVAAPDATLDLAVLRIGDDALTYTAGVVSGFGHEAGVADPAWIMTDATLSGGSSGGTAVDASGRLIGVPTQGTQLDCRPGDTNGDGRIDAQDVGCIPVGGSIGQLRPINLARSLLAQAGLTERPTTPAPSPTVKPTADPSATAATAAAIGDDFRTPNSFDPPTPTPIAESTRAAEATQASEAACMNGPIYPVGAEVVVITDEAAVWQPAAMTVVDQYGNSFHVASDDAPALAYLPAGTRLQITGSYEEAGACDLWPVRIIDPSLAPGRNAAEDGSSLAGPLMIDERDISPAP
ncbi:MAG TPA: serine protease, partial [Thermomicrobiales bacterium]|nr:serine protease [Thermomicrobiales bacterium]